MQSPKIPFLRLLLLIEFLVLLRLESGSSYAGSELFQKCSNTFSCGANITGIRFPFRGSGDPAYCGHPDLVLTCDGSSNSTSIEIVNIKYRVIEIDQSSRTMRIAREDTAGGGGGVCPTVMANTTLDYSVFDYAASCMNYTFFYGCDSPPDFLSRISCGGGRDAYVLAGAFGPKDCESSVVVSGAVMAVEGPLNTTKLGEALEHGFEIRWKIESRSCDDCLGTKGRCGYDSATNRTVCYCRDPPYVSGTCAVANYGAPPVVENPTPPPKSKGMYTEFLAILFFSVILSFFEKNCVNLSSNSVSGFCPLKIISKGPPHTTQFFILFYFI